MREKLYFIRLPLLLVVLFFVGRLALGAAGASYEVGNRLFSMVILQAHLVLLWGAYRPALSRIPCRRVHPNCSDDCAGVADPDLDCNCSFLSRWD